MNNPEPTDKIVRERQRVTAVMNQRHGTHQDGWQWEAEPADAPGWWRVWQHGPQPFDILIGGRGFLGPNDVEVWLSSNPMIHGFTEAEEVLAESSDPVDPAELKAEIERRTRAARENSTPHPAPPTY